jgi:hypothetical protein
MVDVKKRWRAWLRAVHRDFGYLAIGFTVIYAVSGIAQNHIEDWGDVSYKTTERTLTIPAIPDGVPEIVAVKTVADAVAVGVPTGHTRAGDEIHLEYGDGTKVTAIGTNVTIQTRSRRAFIGLANWLHTAKHKKAWKYVSDAFAVLLLYLAISGIFMIKGRLGLKWRGLTLIPIGFAVPILYVVIAGGPEGQKESTAIADDGMKVVPVSVGRPTLPPANDSAAKAVGSGAGAADPNPVATGPAATVGSGAGAVDPNPAGSAVLIPLPPDDN